MGEAVSAVGGSASRRSPLDWNPPVAELGADTARLIGHLVTDQPAGRHGRDARRAWGLALSTGMLIASLDPAVARRILDHRPIAGIEICRDQTLARMDQHPAQLITKQ